jgi:hypothetical protein
MAQITLNSSGVASNGTLALQSNGTTTAVTIDASQNVGIGVASPANVLNIKSATQYKGLQINNATNTIVELIGFNAVNEAGGLKLYNAGNPIVQLISDGNSFINGGNLGIGTTSPSQKLHVYAASGSIRSLIETGNTSSSAFTAKNSGESVDYGVDSTGGFIQVTGAKPLLFYTNATERARIDSSGRFLASTTSSLNGGHTIQSINTSISTFGLTVAHTATTSDVRGLNVSCPNYSGDIGYLFIASRQGSDRLYIRTSGNVENTNNSYGALSDAKLKENVTDATPKLEKLNQVRIVNFNIIGDERKQIGVIAQELEQVFPGMIDESPDKDKEGNDLGTTTKSVKYSVFVPMLIKAIQELKTEFDAYKASHP